MSSDQPIRRRSFFREGLRELLRPLGKTVASVERMAAQLAGIDPPPDGEPAAPQPRRADLFWLRPPGARPESQFLQICQRSGECVKACPVKAIQIDPAGTRGKSAPYISADESACIACDGLYCMAACPSGALVPTARPEIDMGTAVWRDWACLRSSGQECTACIAACPLGASAIGLLEGKINVIPHGCIGCGACQHACPSTPKSILVIPKSIRSGPVGA